MIARFHLTASDYEGPASWRWELADSRGARVADYRVSLNDAAWQFSALSDLCGYVREHSGGRPDEEARIVAEVGDWIGEHVFGPLCAMLVAAHPAIVVVTMPGPDGRLAMLPLESARISGKSLPLHGVTLVTAAAGERSGDPWPDQIDDELRVLALFDDSVGAQALNQRRERQALTELLADEGATRSVAITFRALQYGVTAKRLRRTLELDPGWDVVHVSGYAALGLLRLAVDQRGPGAVQHEALVDMLDLIRGRLKLVTIAACTSSAAAPMELQAPASQSGQSPPVGEGWSASGLPAARDLAEQLGCAVATVRFPVTEEFGSAYFRKLHELMIVSGQPLARAAVMALSSVVDESPRAEYPASALVAPALFGSRAAGLQLAAPPGVPAIYDPLKQKLKGFDDPPDRFVGRQDAMRRASSALALRSGKSGVLLHGMPGAGKTSCALELAYTRDALDADNTFPRMAWYRVTSDPGGIATALKEFAESLANAIEGFPLSRALDDEAALRAELPGMTQFLKEARALIVLDNIDTLLTDAGEWRDSRWGLVIGAFTNHTGLSRLLITSRRIPAVLDPRVLAVPIGPLDRGNAELLARDLPNLRELLDGDAPGMAAPDARMLAARILSAARGHPYLLKLADGAVGHADQIDKFLAAADTVWSPTASSGLFADGDELRGEADYVQVLERWTGTITASLPTNARDLFQVLSCLDEADRLVSIVSDIWADLWRQIGGTGDPPEVAELLAELENRGLATVERDAGNAPVSVQLHPAVAEYGREQTASAIRELIDSQLAAYWVGRAAVGETAAGRAAAPYLFRLLDARDIVDHLDHETLSAAAAMLGKCGVAIPDTMTRLRPGAQAGEGMEFGGLASKVLAGLTRVAGILQGET